MFPDDYFYLRNISCYIIVSGSRNEKKHQSQQTVKRNVKNKHLIHKPKFYWKETLAALNEILMWVFQTTINCNIVHVMLFSWITIYG